MLFRNSSGTSNRANSTKKRLPTPSTLAASGPVHALIVAALLSTFARFGADARVVEEAQPSSTSVERIPTPDGTGDPPNRGFRYVGTASCSASTCHGGDGSRPPTAGGDQLSPQAYSIWIQKDVHSQAYTTLLNEKSQQIADKLELTSAHTAKVCLDCHAISVSPEDLTASHRHTIYDGIGCEACHGAAEKWLAPHKWASWKTRTLEQKAQLGFQEMDRLAIRAKVCAACHIGAGRRDVNHRLIAAGHPRLSFEMSAYHANMPKHWRSESTPRAMLDANLWIVGQLVSASASLQLLSHRANNPQAAWPEFAEYSCFACHHDLRDPSWRQQQYHARPPRRAGSLVWGSWHYPLLAVAAGQRWSDLQPSLAELRNEITLPYPDRDRVQALSAVAQEQLQLLVGATGGAVMGADEIASYLQRLTRAEDMIASGDWDREAQRFLAVASLYHSMGTLHRGRGPSVPFAPQLWREIGNQLRAIRRNLLFYEADDSRRFDSPRRMTQDRRRAVIDAFAEIDRLSGEL